MATIQELISRASPGKWHVAGTLHVNDANSNRVCRCEREEDAAAIVAVWNDYIAEDGAPSARPETQET